MKNKQKKSDFFWNMVGSVCYSVSSFYYLMLVTRVCGVELAGLYSLAFSTAQLLLTIGRYGIRTYQATDVEERFSFAVYGKSRVITCTLMMVAGMFYVGFGSFSREHAAICIWVIALKMIDAVEDVFHGEMQRKYKVALMGQMLALRNVSTCIVFTIVLLLTKRLCFTLMITVITMLVFCVVINTLGIGKRKKRVSEKNKDFINVLKICTPIFASTFLSLYLYNVPKYAIDQYMSIDNQAYYNILFMPSFVITLFGEIISKPLMTMIAVEWNNSLIQFKRIISKILMLLALATVFIIFAGHFIGRFLLELIYGVDLSNFKLEFILLLLGGGVSAATYFLYNVLIAIRHEKCIIIVYVATAICMTIAGYVLVHMRGMIGAAIAYVVSCAVLSSCFLLLLVYFICKRSETSTR